MENRELLNSFVELVQQGAPVVWEITVRQVYVSVVQDGIILIILLYAIYFLGKIIKIQWNLFNLDDNNFREVPIALGAILFIFCVIVSVILATSIIGSLINPEYYAIELLLSYAR